MVNLQFDYLKMDFNQNSYDFFKTVLYFKCNHNCIVDLKEFTLKKAT